MATISELQDRIVQTRAQRGFTCDPVHPTVLLTEELGEIAREVKKTWSPNYDRFTPERLAPELADVFVLLAALASEAGIDLADAVEQKFFTEDGERTWPSAQSRSRT